MKICRVKKRHNQWGPDPIRLQVVGWILANQNSQNNGLWFENSLIGFASDFFKTTSFKTKILG